MSVVSALLRAVRPRQWVKNVLVFTAPVASGQVTSPQVLAGAAVAFVAFCLAASGIYLVNDAIDVEADRAHPKKRTRPIASGELPLPLAWGAAVVLLAAGLGAASVAGPGLIAVIGVYVAVQLAYCLWLKHEPVLELASVASGFLLRAIAGGLATGIVLSQWFLATTAFGSLFMAAGKRYAEARLMEHTGVCSRRVLHRYTPQYLRFVWTLAAGVLVTCYALWAFDVQAATGSPWAVISTVPFVIAVLRYAVDVDGGNAGEPEDLALGDPALLLLAGVWGVTLALSVYL